MAELVGVDTVARLLKLKPRRIQALARDSIIPKADRGRYDLVACVHAYLGALRDGKRAVAKAVTQVEVAKHLDLSERRIRDLASAGVIPRPKRPREWNLGACRVEYIRHLRAVGAGHRSGNGELDLTEERSKLARAQTETAEIKNAVARGELIPAEDVLDHWAQQIVETKTHLRALPHQIKGEIPHLTSEEVEGVRRLVDRALTDLADGLPASASKSGPGGEGPMETPT